MRQPRIYLASQNNHFYSQNPANTDSYRSTQMQNENEIPLAYYLQQYKIIKSQLISFSQMPNAAESLQLTKESILNGWIVNKIKQAINSIYRYRP